MAVLATCHPFLARSRGNCGAAGMPDLFCMPTSYALHCLRFYRLQVTCGSVIKLQHANTGVNLHSHEISYGSGSGQQSVTGFTGGDDANDYWSVRGIEVHLFILTQDSKACATTYCWQVSSGSTVFACEGSDRSGLLCR